MRLIDMDALTDEIQKLSIAVSAKDCVLAHIATQTIIDAAPVAHGQWEILEEPNTFDTFGNHAKYAACTNCGFRWNDIYAVKNYFKCCPSCGARMEDPNGGGV